MKKKASIIAATVMLIGSSAVSYAAGPQNGSHGASGSAPGIQMQSPANNPPAPNGASTFTPAAQMKTYDAANPNAPAPNGASTFAPSHKR